MAAARVSIPAAVRRTIQDIKEIAGEHADEEVYAVLRECNMDPNETVDRLLHRGTFHEVKRKRDKKKESSKESADPHWRSGMQGRDVKGGLGNYPSRQLSSSSGLSGRKVLAGKEIGVNQNMDKGSSPFSNMNTETKTSTHHSSLTGGLSNGPPHIEKNSPATGHLRTSDLKVSDKLQDTEEVVVASTLDTSQPIQEPPPVSELCTSALDPVPSPPLEARSHDTSRPSSSSVRPSASRPSSSYSSSSQQPNVSHKEWRPKLTSKTTQAENVTCEDLPITVGIVAQSVQKLNSEDKKFGDVEFPDKPHVIIPHHLQVTESEKYGLSFGSVQLPDKRNVIIPDHLQVTDPEKYGLSFGSVQLPDKRHVIIPDHLQVTESEKYGLSFGSFGTSFEQTTPKSPESGESSTPPEDDSAQKLYEVVSESATSCHGASSIGTVTDQGVQQLSPEMTDDISPQVVDSYSSAQVAESDLAKDSSIAASHVSHDSAAHTNTSHSTFSLAPQIHGNQNPSLETSESQVYQANEFSASYHTPLYQSIADVDGRLSPFAASGAALKSGNISVLPAQNGESQELQQGINSLSLSSSGSTPLATPTSGVVPSSIAIPQPPLFRQPVGLHVPHYAPSFTPYNQYISPFYFSPHTLHHFMGNGATFPQPPSTGSMYPPVSGTIAAPVKYSATTNHPDDNSGSQMHVGIPGTYAIYGSGPSVYTNNIVMTNGTSVETDHVTVSQFKENNAYVTKQQGDGSAVWIPASGRDVSGLQSTHFYGLPPQGQHLAFAPTQAGHGAFGGMYYPAQTMAGSAVHPLLQPSQTTAGAVDMVPPAASGYQQPQRAQMNWG